MRRSRRSLVFAFLAGAPVALFAQGASRGAISGVVVTNAGRPTPGAMVSANLAGPAPTTVETTTDARGTFRLALDAGAYRLTVRALGFRPAELASVRVSPGDTIRVRVSLAPLATALSTVVVVRSPISVDARDPGSAQRITTATALLLPTARDASAVVALVPGAKEGRLWGAAALATNDFRIDGVSMNHPGRGGDLLELPRDWVEAVEVRGLGAGAEYGNFQGGVIDAITRRGGDEPRMAMRSYHESERLTASNFDATDVGSEFAGRSEVGGEVSGPFVPGRAFYFAGAQVVSSERRALAMRTAASGDYVSEREHTRLLRAMGKVTIGASPVARAEFALGVSARGVSAVGLNALDDRTALPDAEASALWYVGRWTRGEPRHLALEARVAGFEATEAHRGLAGLGIPSVQMMRSGDQPRFQNAAFDERSAPVNQTATFIARREQVTGPLLHAIALGVEAGLGRWRESRIRNGGLTWRPYVTDTSGWSATNAATWGTTGSDWGGEQRLGARERQVAVYLQDEMEIGSRLTLAPGLRATRWSGWLMPCTPDQDAPSCGGEFHALSASALDPRFGIAWDPTGRGTFAFKAHAGRYHQGLYARLFDRTSGANAFTNQRFHYTAPPITDTRQTYTTAQRDALLGPSGFSPFWDESILNESGEVRGYRQPFVDQLSLSVERQLGEHLTLTLMAVHRRNGDIVGLVDRDLATNYTRLTGISVDHRLVPGAILDAHGRPLVLDTLVVSNRDLIDAVLRLNANQRPGAPPIEFAGWSPSEVAALAFAPRVELSTLPGASRRYEQLTASVATFGSWWQGAGSITFARLVGNVPGVTGHGTIGTVFGAGPWVRPNEALNGTGALPDATELEAKLWLVGRLPDGYSAGLLLTHILGERTTPSFTLEGRYVYRDTSGRAAPSELLRQVIGQAILLEPRGARHLSSRTVLDLHVERAFAFTSPQRLVLTLDVLNALGSRAATVVKTSIDDQFLSDPSSVLGAPLERVAPRSLRVGARVEFGP